MCCHVTSSLLNHFRTKLINFNQLCFRDLFVSFFNVWFLTGTRSTKGPRRGSSRRQHTWLCGGPRKVHAAESTFSVDVAKASLRGPLQAGSSQGPRRLWTSWGSPREDLASSIFHPKKVDLSFFQQGSWCALNRKYGGLRNNFSSYFLSWASSRVYRNRNLWLCNMDMKVIKLLASYWREYILLSIYTFLLPLPEDTDDTPSKSNAGHLELPS